jgi:Ca2+-binding EF-hand superfamily protein
MKQVLRILAAVFWLSGHAAKVDRSRQSPDSVQYAPQLRGQATLSMPSHSLISSAVKEINSAIQAYDGEASLNVSAANVSAAKHGGNVSMGKGVSAANVSAAKHGGNISMGKGLQQVKEKQKSEPKNSTEKTHEKKSNDTMAHESVDQATTQAKKKDFKKVDGNGDGKINKQEYLHKTNAQRRVAENRFVCSDTNMDKSLDVNEFIEAQSKPQALEKCITMLLAFKMMDNNRDGHLSQRELWRSAEKERFDSRWAFMIACSDLNDDGKVSPMEFTRDMYGCVEDSTEKAAKKFSNFTSGDKNRDGCIDQGEMIKGIRMLMGLDQIPQKLVSGSSTSQATANLAKEWISCVDFDLGGCLDREEFEDGLLNPTPTEKQCIGNAYNWYEDDMDFHIMDTSNDNKISEEEYYSWCSKVGMDIDSQKSKVLFESADKNGDRFVTAQEFEDAGKNHQGDGANNLFFHRSLQPPWSMRSLTRWRGSIQKTWAGYFKLDA